MTTNILIDTDVLIDYSKAKSKLLQKYLKLQAQAKTQLCINPIILTEFFTDSQLKNSTKFRQAETFLKLFKFIPVDRQIALEAAKILRLHQSDFLADAYIAATCLVNQLSLLTRNRRHFSSVPNLQFVN
jgi:predicted nucleic acid-binding protein